MSVESIPRPNMPWKAVSLAVPMLLASLGVSIANIALPAIVDEFAAPMAGGQWVVLAYLLATTVCIVPAGYLGDRFGRRRVLLAGLILYTAASLACALAPSLAFLIAARAVQGAGAAALVALVMPLIRDISRDGSLGARMGLLGSMSAVGTALGPFLGGLIVASFGWPAVFMILVLPGALSFLLLWRVLPDQANIAAAAKGRFDTVGVVLLAIALTAFALSWSVRTDTSGPFGWVLPLIAVTAGGFFVLVELRASQPLIRLGAFRNLVFSAAMAANTLVSALMMTTLVIGPFFLMSGLGLGASQAGLVMALGPFAAMLSGIPAGWLTDRIGTSAAALAGLLLVMTGAFGLAFLPAEFSVAGYVLGLAILTPGYQLFLAANNAAVMADSAESQRGAVSGLLNLSRNLGFITGAAAMGALFAAMLGGADGGAAASDAVVVAASRTFAAAGAMIAAAVIVSLAGRRAARGAVR